MSLLVMFTDPPSAMDRLSPSWIRRSISRKDKPAQEPVSKSKEHLSPQSTSGSSISGDSRSLISSKSDRHASIRGLVNRLRSSSNASLASNRSYDLEFAEVENWFYGFRKYNHLVTTKISPEQLYPSQEFTKASKALTKNCGGKLLHGLPEAAFDFSLLWCPAGQLSRKDNEEPSWSWTAYSGPVNFPFDPTSCPDVYTAPRSDGEWFRSEIVNLHVGPDSAPYTVRREKCNSIRIKYPPYFHAPRGSEANVDSNTLRFTASTISAEGFTAEQLHYQDKEIPCSQLLNDNHAHCGVIMDFESSISEPCSTGPFEFVLLSRNLRREPAELTRRPVAPTMHPPGTPIWDGEHFLWDEEVVDFDEEKFEPGPWKMLNVMLIKWVGQHAVRVAVARIHEDAWLQRGPVRKDIVLK